MLSRIAIKELEKIFGSWISFNKNDRILYSHDHGTLPFAIRVFVGSCPDAVVKPADTDDIIKLIALSVKYRIPLTPRGAGTAGYGGSIPVHNGITVDFSRMNRVLDIDENAMTAVVEPGALFCDLERALNKKGLEMKSYPSSALSATAGGWVAQGGFGIGSLKYGSISDEVIEVEMAVSSGEVLRMQKKSELEMVCECQGITGIITKVKLSVKKKEEIIPVLTVFTNAEDLGRTLLAASHQLEPYSISFANPRLIALKQETSGNYEIPKEWFSALFAFLEKDYDEDKFEHMVLENGGGIMSREQSLKEWGERLNPLKMKRQGTTLIPSDAVVPLDDLAVFLEGLEENKENFHLGVEGMVIGSDDASIHAFILGDEREKIPFVIGYSNVLKVIKDFILGDEREKIPFVIGYSNVLKVIKAAKDNGGRIYSTGLWYSSESLEYFGRDRLSRMKFFKLESDPNNIFNPGKVFYALSLWSIPFISFRKIPLDLGMSILNLPIAEAVLKPFRVKYTFKRE